MLRRLDVRAGFRSLSPGFWPTDRPLGRRTVVYGHNGSGKSTLSDLLLDLASGQSPVEVDWEDENGTHHRIRPGNSAPAPLSVFTKRWVEDNLSDFLAGQGAAAIVTLGEQAIGARDEEVRLIESMKVLQESATDAEDRRKSLVRSLEQLGRDVQSTVVDQLREFDPSHFTKSRYSLPRVCTELRTFTGAVPSGNEYAESLKRLGDGAGVPIPAIAELPPSAARDLAGLDALLDWTPTRQAIDELDGDLTAQSWVENGLELHTHRNRCLFCAGELTELRRQELERHFDASWRDIRTSALRLQQAVTAHKCGLIAWLDGLPQPGVFASDLRDAYTTSRERVGTQVAELIEVLAAAEQALQEKATDPSARPDAPDVRALTTDVGADGVRRTVTEHNTQVREHVEVEKRHVAAVLQYLIGSKATTFQDAESALAIAEAECAAAEDAVERAQRRIAELRQQQFSNTEMAETLSHDLARVYGKDHLSVAVADDGRSYACYRGTLPASHLSDGERTTLSLLYFLRWLQDESDNVEPGQRIVVIDDPTSSLDRESLFATHEWLLDRLPHFGQSIVLTHDFSLLRLFALSQKSGWNTSVGKIKKGDVQETRFPQVAFLEVYAADVGGQRRTRVEELPDLLRKTVSEYAYLFGMVMKGVADSAEHERLFLLPNAARRVLEVFCSYKAPHLPNFDQQLRSLVDDSSAPYRDVYDFCNRFSHGEGPESVEVLDARTVHQHIRRCMQFLRSVDPEHFKNMCRATGADERPLDE